MSGSRDPVAEPDTRLHIAGDDAEAVLIGEARQAVANESALRRHCRRGGKLRVAQNLLGDGGQRQAIAQEVEAGHRLVVKDLAVDFRCGEQGIDGVAAVEALQILDEGRRGNPSMRHRGPIGDESAQDGRPLRHQHFAPDRFAIEAGEFANRMRGARCGRHQK